MPQFIAKMIANYRGKAVEDKYDVRLIDERK